MIGISRRFYGNLEVISLQMNLAYQQSKKKWWIVSKLLHKLHFKFHYKFWLVRLSLVNTTSLIKYHIKILIFNNIFSFHSVLLFTTCPTSITTLYMEFFFPRKLLIYPSSIMVVQQTLEIIKKYIQISRPPSDNYKHLSKPKAHHRHRPSNVVAVQMFF